MANEYSLKLDLGSGLVDITDVNLNSATYKRSRIIQNRIRQTIDGTIDIFGDQYDTIKSSTDSELDGEIYKDSTKIADIILPIKAENAKYRNNGGSFEVISDDIYRQILEGSEANIDTDYNTMIATIDKYIVELTNEDDDDVHYLQNCVLMTDFIEYAIGQIDSTIIIDTNTFDFFNDAANPELNLIYLQPARNFSKEVFNKDVKLVTEELLSLSELFEELLLFFNIEWYLTSAKKLRFAWLGDKTYNTGTDITDEYPATGYEFNQYQYSDVKESQIKREIKDQNPNVDFLGNDIFFPKVPKKNILELTRKFYTDVWGIEENDESISSGMLMYAGQRTEEDITVTWQDSNGLFPSAPQYDVSTWNPILNTLDLTENTTTNPKYIFAIAGEKDQFYSTTRIGIRFNATFINFAVIINIVGYTLTRNVLVSNIITTGANELFLDITSATSHDVYWFEIQKNGGSGTCNFDSFEIYRTHNNIRQATSILGSGDVANMEMSLAYLDNKFLAFTPENSAKVNGSTKTGIYQRPVIEQNEIITKQIDYDYDFDDYVETGISSKMIVNEISMPLENKRSNNIILKKDEN